MSTRVRPRFGSLQFWPRKRARKFLPRVNWDAVKNHSDKNKKEGLLGFVGYKVGMSTALVKDDTDKSMTKGKKIAIPVTILEVPNMKIFSIRFYKGGKVLKDLIVSNDKELKKKVKIPKNVKKELEKIEGVDDLRVIIYSIPKQIGIKKKPDLIEIGIAGNFEDKFNLVKNLVGKEISMQEVLKGSLFDVRALTKGKGYSGPVKRFGITLKAHKSEKGRRNPGSIGPWHPAHVTFRVPMAGQLGMFTRVHYNLNILDYGAISEKNINRNEGFKHYGKIRTNYIILRGSVQGPQKRQVLVTQAMRPTKKIMKNKFEFLELK
jgi:large subunit ribosomal protein L3